MKYIDAEKLTAEIERLYEGEAPRHDQQCEFEDGYFTGIATISKFIDSLQQEQQEKKEVKFVFPKFLYARTTNNKTIDVSYAPQNLDAIEYIRSDSLHQEQPEVDLDKETIIEYVHNNYHYDKDFDGYGHSNLRPVFTREDLIELAHHFFNLGLNARK